MDFGVQPSAAAGPPVKFEPLMPLLADLRRLLDEHQPSPATHAIWIDLKAGDTADLICSGCKLQFVDTTAVYRV